MSVDVTWGGKMSCESGVNLSLSIVSSNAEMASSYQYIQDTKQ